MCADPRRRAARALASCLAVLPLATGAAADQLAGQFQVQYQNVEQRIQVLRPDGTRRDTTLQREIWVQNYQLTHSARIGAWLNVYSQLQLDDLSQVGRPDASRTPYGALRLAHPVFGFTGSYRPSSVTTGIRLPGLANSDLAGPPQGRLTTRSQELLFTGYLAPSRLPRIDLSWIRRHRDRNEQVGEETGLTRDARVGYELGPLSVRGGYNDLSTEVGATGPSRVIQRSATAGAGLTLAPVEALSLALNYDFSNVRRATPGPDGDRALTHSATLGASLRQSARSTWGLSYLYRRSDLGRRDISDLVDHDGALTYTWSPSRGARLSAAGGARTVQGTGRRDLQRHVGLIASAAGRVRPGWTGTASASHVTQWDPDRGPFSVENLTGGSRFRLAQGLELHADLQVIANGDTAARDARVTSQRSVGVEASPLRSITVRYSVRSYRIGPGLFDAVSDARSSTLDLRWRLHPTLELNGGILKGGSLSRNAPPLTTRQATLQWRPGSAFQLTGTWTRSDQARGSETGTLLTGREFLSGRMVAALGRRTTVSAGIHEANADASGGSRQFDAALTRTFGG